MCGRYGITISATEAMRRLNISLDRRTDPDTAARYNVPPGTAQLVAIGDRDATDHKSLDAVHWGFLPSWQNQASKSSINMRLESAGKSYWRKAFERRRCAIPASWWYEWEKIDGGKQPFAIRPGDTEGFFFAGVWSAATGVPDDHKLHGRQTFAILTQPADPDIADIHHRMPVALTDDGIQEWLSPGDDHDHLTEIIADTSYSYYESWPVDQRVGNPANDDPSIVERRFAIRRKTELE